MFRTAHVDDKTVNSLKESTNQLTNQLVLHSTTILTVCVKVELILHRIYAMRRDGENTCGGKHNLEMGLAALSCLCGTWQVPALLLRILALFKVWPLDDQSLKKDLSAPSRPKVFNFQRRMHRHPAHIQYPLFNDSFSPGSKLLRTMTEYRIKLSDELKRSLISKFTTYGDSNDNLNDSAKISDTSCNHHEDPEQRRTKSSPSTSSALYEKADKTCSGASPGRTLRDASLETSLKASLSSGYALPECTTRAIARACVD